MNGHSPVANNTSSNDLFGASNNNSDLDNKLNTSGDNSNSLNSSDSLDSPIGNTTGEISSGNVISYSNTTNSPNGLASQSDNASSEMSYQRLMSNQGRPPIASQQQPRIGNEQQYHAQQQQQMTQLLEMLAQTHPQIYMQLQQQQNFPPGSKSYGELLGGLALTQQQNQQQQQIPQQQQSQQLQQQPQQQHSFQQYDPYTQRYLSQKSNVTGGNTTQTSPDYASQKSTTMQRMAAAQQSAQVQQQMQQIQQQLQQQQQQQREPSPTTTANSESDWTQEEEQKLNEALTLFPQENFTSSVVRCTSISHHIRTKSTRAVAAKIATLPKAEEVHSRAFSAPLQPQSNVSQNPSGVTTPSNVNTSSNVLNKLSTKVEQSPVMRPQSQPINAASLGLQQQPQSQQAQQALNFKNLMENTVNQNTNFMQSGSTSNFATLLSQQQQQQQQQQNPTTAEQQQQFLQRAMMTNNAMMNSMNNNNNNNLLLAQQQAQALNSFANAPMQILNASNVDQIMSQSKMPLHQNSFSFIESEQFIQNILMDNMRIITTIKNNVQGNNLLDNIKHMKQFRDNIIKVLTHMSNMPGIMSQMPPIPVKLNTINIM